MKELLTYIVQNLVSDPDSVAITENAQGDEIVYELRVAPEDMGRVIGKQGRIAKAIRTVVRAAANKTETKVAVEID